MLIKKTTLAIVLNVLFGGVGYLYIKERKPLAIFLIFVTIYELIRNMTVTSDTAMHTLPMLSLFGSIPGVALLSLMAVDIHFLVRRQANGIGSSRARSIKAT